MRVFLLLISFILQGCERAPHAPTNYNYEGREPEFKKAQCLIYRDSSQIPHAKSETLIDSAVCLGFLHGQDRGFQMDYLRRTYQGRTAEIIGVDGIKSDFTLRLLGISELARNLYLKATPELKNWLAAYTYGVNQAFQKLPKDSDYEFKKFSYLPEPWHPIDSLGIFLLQSFDQTKKSFENDISELARVEKYGAKTLRLFSEEGTPWQTTILKKGEYLSNDQTRNRTLPQLKSNWAFTLDQKNDLSWFEMPDLGIGSNNWVVSPKLSKGGYALLANDPHLSLKHPPFWYWAHLESSEVNAIGATLPGTPVIASGFNKNAAWGLTNSYMDTTDIYSIAKDDIKTESFRPLIWFKFGPLQVPFFFKSFDRTADGYPILPIPQAKENYFVLKWSARDLSPGDFDGLKSINGAKNAEDIDSSLKNIGLPSWNYVYADTSGSIGYRAIGKIPKRNSPPVLGVENQQALQRPWEYLAPAEMPHNKNPQRGFIATANNSQWGTDSKVHAGRAHSTSLRAHRIETLLQSGSPHSPESFKNIQCDIQVTEAPFLVPMLLQFIPEVAPFSLFRQQLMSWDYLATASCLPCAPFRLWMSFAQKQLGGNETLLFHLLSEKPVSSEVEDVFKKTLTQAFEELGIKQEKDFKPWRDVHKTYFSHLGGEKNFPAKPLSTPGDDNSVNLGKAEWNKESQTLSHIHGASQRLIVELSTPPRGFLQLAGPNLDISNSDRNETAQGWHAWSHCEYSPVEFPIDWTSADVIQKSQKLTF